MVKPICAHEIGCPPFSGFNLYNVFDSRTSMVNFMGFWEQDGGCYMLISSMLEGIIQIVNDISI